MTRSRIGLFLALLIAVTGSIPLRAATTNASPDFQEVFDLIRQHAAGVSAEELNHAAVQGLLAALGPKVSLGTNNASANATTNPVAEVTLFDGDIVYLRIARVDDGLAKGINAAYERLKATNKVSGMVLDLRYTAGSDYKAAADTADLFVSKNHPLLNWGEGVVMSHEKDGAIRVPVGILVNRKTSGAAEALAAVVRATGAGLILAAARRVTRWSCRIFR